MIQRRKLGAAAALLLSASFLTSAQGNAAPVKTIRIEAETGTLAGGTVVLREGTGFTGTGYVGGFEGQAAALRFSVSAPAGIYSLRLRYRAPGEKGIDVAVNGKKTSVMVPGSGAAFATRDIGKVELKAGANSVAIERGWGYYQIDSLLLVPAPAPAALRPVTAKLSDGKATPEARRLMRFLTERYGKQTLSGQHTAGDTAFITRTTGVTPAILSDDLIEYSPSRVEHGAKPAGLTERLIAANRSGQILSVLWHWNAPKDLLDKKFTNAQGKEIDASWYRGFYTEATTFDVARALADPKSDDYRLLLRDIDTIARELKKLQAANVPVLWRPLHEAEGGWFWWGARGPAPFKKLWRLMYDRLTVHHGLHNLIWVYTSGGKKDWYPGDSTVDIVGTDAYPSDVTDPLSGIWETLLSQFSGRKLLALTEFGGVPDTERMARFGVRWSYFASWGGNLGPKKVTETELKRLYTEKRVVNKGAGTRG